MKQLSHGKQYSAIMCDDQWNQYHIEEDETKWVAQLREREEGMQ